MNDRSFKDSRETPEEVWPWGPPGPPRPNVARVYDAWLGGKDNFAVDREAAARVEAVAPWVVEGARANRAFVVRAVEVLCRRGVRQFVDLGSGLPTARNVHEVARECAVAPRVVYVDHDPVVVAHARALLATDANTAAVQGDIGDVASLRADRVFGRLIDLDAPVGVLATAVLHFVPEDARAARIISAWRGVMAPGSHVVVSHVAPGQGEQARVQCEAAALYREQVAPFTFRDAEQVRRLLDGFEVLAPGVVPEQRWRVRGPVPRGVVPLWGAVAWLSGGGVGIPRLSSRHQGRTSWAGEVIGS